MRDEQAPGRGPGDRDRLADVGRDAKGPRALLHHGDRIFAAVQHAELRRLPRRLSEAGEMGLALAGEVELSAPGLAEKVQLAPEIDAAVVVGVFERAELEEEIDEFIGRRFRRADADRDLVRARGLAPLAQEIENLEGAVEPAHASADGDVRNLLFRHEGNPATREASCLARRRRPVQSRCDCQSSPIDKRVTLSSIPSVRSIGIVSIIMERNGTGMAQRWSGGAPSSEGEATC